MEQQSSQQSEPSFKGEVQEAVSGLKKMPKRKLVGWIILVIVVFVVLVQYLNAARYDALVQVIKEDKIGVNPTGERLDFGDLPRDKDATRVVTLVNNSPYKVSSYVMVWKFGGISDFIKISKNYFSLKPGATEKLEFSVHIPNSAEFKYYKGRVIIFQIPKIWP